MGNILLSSDLHACTEFDEVLFRRLIGKVTVHDEKFTVEFKSGVSVEIEE